MVVQVQFDVRKPETHLVRVHQSFPATQDAERTFHMANWVPGSYKIRDFPRHVQDLHAKVGGRRGRVRQVSKDAWQVSRTKGKQVELQFDIYCRELTVDTSHVTSEHAHLFPATLVLYDGESRGEPHKVSLRKPSGWSHWSGLETKAWSGTLETAQDYDHLIDCPIEVGPRASYHEFTFNARGKRHRFVTWNPPGGVDWQRIQKDVRAIVMETARVWGSVPYDHYTFIAHAALDHGGGLEHRNSTVLGIDPTHLLSDDKIHSRLLPLVAHEYFHTWNVKRILPQAFTPYDLQQETYTGLLWLFEGFTTYYELPILRRSGVVDDDAWGKIVAEMLDYYELAIGRGRRSVADSSRLTWTLLYQPHEHNVNRNISYYVKGLFVGLCLDWHLRMEGVQDGLDAVMRLLWKRHGKTGEGLAEDRFAALVEEATGVNVARRLGQWTEGTTELPIDKALRDLGWEVKREWKDDKLRHGIGLHLKSDGTIERIPEDAPAFTVLQPQDQLVAVEGWKYSRDRLLRHAAGCKPGDTLRIDYFREGRLLRSEVPVMERRKDKITVQVRKGDAAATRRRHAWLGDH